jgi:LemA protein
MQIGLMMALGALAMFLAWWVSTHNQGIRVFNHIRESRANIDVQLKRRHDLIPNLVAVCKGYATHEQAVFEAVVDARNKAVTSLEDMKTGYQPEADLVGAVNRMMAVVEGYPQLKADGQFLALQKELVNTEDRIAAARRFYNANCRSWNVLRESFPSSLIVKGAPAFYYEVEGVDVVPVVEV